MSKAHLKEVFRWSHKWAITQMSLDDPLGSPVTQETFIACQRVNYSFFVSFILQQLYLDTLEFHIFIRRHTLFLSLSLSHLWYHTILSLFFIFTSNAMRYLPNIILSECCYKSSEKNIHRKHWEKITNQLWIRVERNSREVKAKYTSRYIRELQFAWYSIFHSIYTLELEKQKKRPNIEYMWSFKYKYKLTLHIVTEHSSVIFKIYMAWSSKASFFDINLQAMLHM